VEVTLPAAPKAVCKVEVEAVDLNFADILQCQGSYQVKLDAPFTPGMNAVGKVIEVGKNSGYALGDRFTCPWAGCAFYQLDKLNFHFVQVPTVSPSTRTRVDAWCNLQRMKKTRPILRGWRNIILNGSVIGKPNLRAFQPFGARRRAERVQISRKALGLDFVDI
jgi:hypothetical protein